MKKSFMLIFLGCLVMQGVQAQKFALIDMEYIMRRIPAYEQAVSRLDSESKKYQEEIDAIGREAESMYKAYQNEVSKLTAAQRTVRENEIVAKERQAAELRQKYFAPQGVMSEERDRLMKPVNDSVYEAVKRISMQRGYSLVLDRASDAAIIFASPAIDISDEVLSLLGYSD